jgi:Tol biopolymer transport system component
MAPNAIKTGTVVTPFAMRVGMKVLDSFRAVFVCCLVIGGLLVLPTYSSAQYFGQNKVQYRKLDFKVLRTEHFDIYFYPEERAGTDVAARMAERWYARLSRFFHHELRGRQPLILYASPTDFQQTNVIPGDLGEGTGGVTEPIRRRIVLPLAGPLADTDHVLGHELVHAFQFDITMPVGAPGGVNGAEQLPLWFIEGMAEYLSLGPVDPNTAMWMRDAARQERLPAIKDLDNPKYFPYRWGQAFWAYVGGTYGDDLIPLMLSTAGAAGDINTTTKKVLGVDTKELSEAWHASIHQTYDRILAATTAPSGAGRPVIRGTEQNTGMNVGPAMSPDGKWIAFLSSRGLLSVDLYVADAMTGEVVRKLTSTATDPHVSSIEFIYSAGTWDSESKRLAIATVASGRPALAIYDALNGRKQREIPIGEVDQILNPAWAPDGHAIAFSGLSQGLSDLYVYDLTASRLQRLTNDAYAELHPAWSPDSRLIAFATDRFTTNLETLAIGDYELATIDAANGRVQRVQTFGGADSINPQWSGDGRQLYFISNRTGIAELYGVTIANGTTTQLTNISTGTSGITSSSPALSVANMRHIAAFSVYNDGKYDIHTMDTAGGGAQPAREIEDAAVLPPATRKGSDVATMLGDPAFGLPPRQQQAGNQITDYKPSLALEGIGQPSVAVGVNRFGSSIGGGLSFYFSDLLGNHSLVTAVQLNSGIGNNFSPKDTAAEAAYIDQSHRWQWGVIGGQVPYLSGGISSTVGVTPQTGAVQVDQVIIDRQTEQSASLMTAYPFDRARRVEFQAGATRVSFDRRIETTISSLVTGNVISDEVSKTQTLAPALNLANTSAAFVYDTSAFGATSPISGQRYRVEASPTFGALTFTNLLVDYRRYLMPAPFYTIAARVIHDGRYGHGGEDQRLFPMYIGYPALVRGYDINTFGPSDCVPSIVSQCPAFDRLLGSRILVGNLEFRFPLLRPFGATSRMYGPIPIEVALFADGGVAWNRGQTPALFGGSREGVSSAGVALRANLFGYAVGQLDFSRPFQRPGNGWVIQFNLAPGF